MILLMIMLMTKNIVVMIMIREGKVKEEKER